MSRLRPARGVVSLFSGAMGLDLGLESAGLQVRVAVEANKTAAATIRRNRPELPLIERSIENVSTEEILGAAGLEVGEALVVSAGPSCQTFSTAGRRQSLAEPRGTLFRHFLRVVSEAKPRFFVMENVRGILSAAVVHRPLAQRGPGHPPLVPEEQYGSAFELILAELRQTGYSVFFDLMNAADFGVPQRRDRLMFVGSRDGQRVTLPLPTHAEQNGSGRESWTTLRSALAGLEDTSPEFTEIPPGKRRYMAMVPEGGNWRDLPEKHRRAALGRAFESWGGRTGFYRRLAWDEPTPALTTRPDSKATMLCHPSELRPLTVKEYARVQQFPDEWEFEGSPAQKYQQIGNAVPVGLGRLIGEAVWTAASRKPGRAGAGVIYCDNEVLLNRIRKARGTVLNPARMRKVAGLREAREWMSGTHRRRAAIAEGIRPWSQAAL
ncbi:MAG TPA: DNA cytosine methyltransferase [Acidimicrobiales bacterium]|nr:DNA cytosine methyltransferase [Acidimicrobiales bacterium]